METVDDILQKQEELLKAAVARTMQAVHQRPTSENLRAYQQARRALEEFLSTRSPDGEVRFRRASDVVRWVLGQGYLVSDRTVEKHLKRIPRDPDGTWPQKVIEEYARRTWENPSQGIQPRGAEQAPSSMREAVLAEQYRKLKIANDVAEGALILRSTVEQEFAARAAFLRRDLENLGPRLVDRLVESMMAILRDAGAQIPDGFSPRSVIADLELEWDRRLAEHLDTYARSRGFVDLTEASDEA